MPYAKIDKERLFYALHPSREREAQPVVLIHGAGGNHLIWPSALRRLSSHTATYLPDLPGHGRSGGRARSTIRGYADTMWEWCQALGLQSVALIGHSMGGAIALSLAACYPDLCETLVLLNSTARFSIPNDILHALDTDKRTAVDAICRWAFAPQPLTPWIEATRQLMDHLPLESLRADYRACQIFDGLDLLGTIRARTLVIGGDEDVLTPPQDQEDLANGIHGAELILLEGSGHMSPLLKAQEIRQILKKFMEI